MEPISTLALTVALAAAIPASRKPQWEDVAPYRVVEPHTADTSTFFQLKTPASFDEPSVGIELELPSALLSPKELLMREILSYSQYEDGWNGDGSIGPDEEAIHAATDFIQKIPSRLTLPRPMLSFDGEIGLYWGMESGYAEVTFESNGEFSFFSRSEEGEEKFQENMRLNTLTDNWFWDGIGVFDQVLKAA